MKKFTRLLPGIMALAMLTSCGSKPEPENSGSFWDFSEEPTIAESADAPTSSSMTAPKPTEPPTEPPKKEPDVIPLLSINTVNTKSTDFVTKPVNGYVSGQIATWTPNYIMPPEPYYEECTVTLTNTDSTVLLDEVGAKVKVRGNWTTSYDKKPLRIKFDEKQSMLGLNDGAQLKNWVLLAEYKDGSMLRNKTALAAAREILGADGLYAADAELVEVEINGLYWGVYLLTELQQVNPERVNITEPEKGYTGTDIGYLLEFDGYFSNEDDLHQFHVDYADNAPLTPYDGKNGGKRTMKVLPEKKKDPKKDIGITIKSDINSQEQHDFIENYVNCVYDIMYYAAYEDKAYVFDDSYSKITEAQITPREAVERVVDIDSLADTYLIAELTCDADIYWSSFYMDVDFGEGGSRKLRFEAPWDFDSSMGNKDRCADGTGFYAANIVPDVNGGPKNGGEYETINPWLAVLMYEDWYQDVIREKWTKASDSGVFERASAMIQADKTKLAPAFERNYGKWNNIKKNAAFANELSDRAAACKDQAEAADYLAEWLGKRVEFMNESWHK